MNDEWFSHSSEYWKTQEATVDGMLGGLGDLSTIDIMGSKKFLQEHFKGAAHGLCLDCGAGIGRISEALLLPLFGRVSLLEGNEDFCQKARETLPPGTIHQIFPIRMGHYRASMTDQPFDLVWIQWVIIYNSDDELISFLREAKASLRPNGLIGLKDNVLPRRNTLQPIYDESDHSVTRSRVHLESIFATAGLTIVAERQQEHFPRSLFPVWMYLLR